MRGIQHPLAKLSNEEVVLLRRERAKTGASYAALGARYGVSANVAHGICRGWRWPHVGGPLAEPVPSRRKLAAAAVSKRAIAAAVKRRQKKLTPRPASRARHRQSGA